MDITTQGTLTRNLRKPFGTSLLRSGSDWILDQISWTQTSLLLTETFKKYNIFLFLIITFTCSSLCLQDQ